MNKSEREQITSNLVKDLSVPRALGTIAVISLAAFLFLIWLIYFNDTTGRQADWTGNLPALNALLNSASAILIMTGYSAIRRGNYLLHMRLMMSAFVTSSLFLISYLIYHFYTGHTPFPGEGWIRPAYFTILISHIILSAFVLPLVLTSFYFAWSGKFGTHRRVSKWTLPVWLYVSVTGVLIFFILRSY
ncbi:MAG: DUF420 domain-containing protein [Balneolaceae bacterium]